MCWPGLAVASPAELTVQQSGGASVPTSVDLTEAQAREDTPPESAGVDPVHGRTEFAQQGPVSVHRTPSQWNVWLLFL